MHSWEWVHPNVLRVFLFLNSNWWKTKCHNGFIMAKIGMILSNECRRKVFQLNLSTIALDAVKYLSKDNANRKYMYNSDIKYMHTSNFVQFTFQLPTSNSLMLSYSQFFFFFLILALYVTVVFFSLFLSLFTLFTLFSSLHPPLKHKTTTTKRLHKHNKWIKLF